MNSNYNYSEKKMKFLSLETISKTGISDFLYISGRTKVPRLQHSFCSKFSTNISSFRWPIFVQVSDDQKMYFTNFTTPLVKVVYQHMSLNKRSKEETIQML